MTSRHYYRCLQVYENLRLVCRSKWSMLNYEGLLLTENLSENQTKSTWSVTICNNIDYADAMHAISTRSWFQRLAMDWRHVEYNSAKKWSQLAKLFQWVGQIYWSQEWFQCTAWIRTGIKIEMSLKSCKAKDYRTENQTILLIRTFTVTTFHLPTVNSLLHNLFYHYSVVLTISIVLPKNLETQKISKKSLSEKISKKISEIIGSESPLNFFFRPKKSLPVMQLRVNWYQKICYV